MDTANCPDGFATDNTFVLDINLCDTSLITYEVVFVLTLAVRFVLTALIGCNWARKKRLYTTQGGGSVFDKRRWEKRIPFTPLVHVAICIVWLLMLLLIRFNVTNATNGGAFLLWTLAFNGVAIYNFIIQRKLVKLGKKVIPISRAKLDKLVETNDTDERSRFDILGTYDSVLRVILTLQIVSVAVQTVCGVVLGLIFPGVFVWMQVAYVMEGVFLFLLLVGYVYQLQRIYVCVQGCTMETQMKQGILTRFRINQIHGVTLCLFSTAIHVVLTIGVFESRWYIIMYSLSADSCACFVAALDYVFARLKSRRKRSMPGPMVTALSTNVDGLSPINNQN